MQRHTLSTNIQKYYENFSYTRDKFKATKFLNTVSVLLIKHFNEMYFKIMHRYFCPGKLFLNYCSSKSESFLVYSIYILI